MSTKHARDAVSALLHAFINNPERLKVVTPCPASPTADIALVLVGKPLNPNAHHKQPNLLSDREVVTPMGFVPTTNSSRLQPKFQRAYVRLPTIELSLHRGKSLSG